MGLSLVRCPVCDRRYNVSGIPAGTRVLCTACRSILTVPALRASYREPLWRRVLPQSSSSQIVLAVVSGLFLASGAYVAVRTQRPERPEAVALGTPAAPAPTSAVWNPDRPEKSREVAVATVTRTLYSEFDPDRFIFQDCAPFLMGAERNDRVALWALFNRYEAALKTIHEAFLQEFQGPLGLSPIQNEVLPCIIFTSRDSFDAYCERSQGRRLPREIPGVYEYARRRFVMVHERAAQANVEILMHEVVHQLVHYYTTQRCEGVRRPTCWWFQEGLGTYFESVRRDDGGRLVLGPLGHHSRLKTVQDALANDRSRFIPLSMLTGMSVDDFWKEWYTEARDDEELDRRTRTAELAYGEACAFTLFLRHASEGKYRAVFDDYFAAELKGEGSRSRFEEILRERHPDSDLSVLEEEFVEFIQTLKP